MKYHVTTFGCQMNHSDSERISTILEQKGYTPSKQNEADLIVINMCSVRQSAVNRVDFLVKKFKNKKTLLTGCVLPKDRTKLKQHFDYILSIKDIEDWAKRRKDCKYLDIEPNYKTFPVAYVPISIGCDNLCTYCCVPFTRGREIQRSKSKIIKEVSYLIKKGFKEIWLLGENVNSYSNFDLLLKEINEIKGDFWIRFTSPNPKDFSHKLINALKNLEKVTPYLNLPLQSGDDTILGKMNRRYTIKQYEKLVNDIRNNIPDISLSTDIIVGFPTETKTQFQNTKKFFKKMQFDMAYISQYSQRPHTVASKMKDNVTIKEKKKRAKELEVILKQTSERRNKQFLNKIERVLPTEEKNGYLIGKSFHYKSVKFKGSKDLIGIFCNVKIIKASIFSLKGELI